MWAVSYVGEIAALGAAMVWALATGMYSRFSHQFSALQMNIIKGAIASAMMLLVLPVLPLPSMTLSREHTMVLGISGVIGIAIGDSAYFAALKRIGANKTLLLESLAPPLSGLLAMAALGSVLSLQSWIGVLLTSVAVIFVVFQPAQDTQSPSLSGIGFGLMASVCQALGVVISHYALVAGDVPPLLGALVRLTIGVACVSLAILLLEERPFRQVVRNFRRLSRPDFAWLLSAIFVGTFLALWLQQIALKYANPAVAQTLIATSPLFMMGLYVWRGEAISAKTAFGTLAAMIGISLFFL